MLDAITKKLLVFDETGKFEKKIGQFGQGPEEFIALNDFDIDSDGYIYIYDGAKKKLLKYSAKNEFIKSLKLPFIPENFATLPNGKFFWLI